jgi:hypothetical protein
MWDKLLYWSLLISCSMIIAIPIAAAFIWAVLLLVMAVHDGY